MADATLTGANYDFVNNRYTVNVRIVYNGAAIDLTIPISPQAISAADQLREAQNWLRSLGQDLTTVVVVSPTGRTTP
jgi:hypothetical protein